MTKPAVFLDTRPLLTGHAIRGIGAYTAQLREQLQVLPSVRVVQSEEEADIIHYPFFDFFVHSLPIWSRKPRVVTIHDVIPLQFPEHYPVGIRGKIHFVLQRQALRKVNHVITDSFASARAIADTLPVAHSNISPIYLAANPQLQVPNGSVLRKVRDRYHLPDEYILYVGDINYNKNIPALIEALAELPTKVHLVCVGKNFFPQPIPEWTAIEAQLEQHAIRERVHFLTEVRAVDLTELSAVYHQALAYVQPSFAEGFGLPVLEAMRCKTPVIAARNSSLVEVGGDHVLFVEPTGANIAAAVQSIRDWSTAVRDAHLVAAHTWQDTFSWQKTAEETVAVYYQVLGLQI